MLIYWDVLRIYLGFYGDWMGFNAMFLEFIRSYSNRIVCDFSWDLRRFSGNMMGQWSECLNGCSGNMMGIYCHNFHTVSWAMVVSTGGQRAPKTVKSQICLLLPTGKKLNGALTKWSFNAKVMYTWWILDCHVWFQDGIFLAAFEKATEYFSFVTWHHQVTWHNMHFVKIARLKMTEEKLNRRAALRFRLSALGDGLRLQQAQNSPQICDVLCGNQMWQWKIHPF